MRKKLLIIGIAAVGMVAAAVPIANAASGGSDGPSLKDNCRTYQYTAPKGTPFRFHPEGKDPSQSFPATADLVFNAHDFHAYDDNPDGADSVWEHGNAYVTVNGVVHRVSDIDIQHSSLRYVRCWW